MNEKIITLAHGSGGKATHKLIMDYIKKYFSNEILDRFEDSALLNLNSKKIVLTTDSFVVTPLFFSGGNIGKLSICGTVNDISAMGAVPKYVTAGLILEEGLKISDFEKIIKSMADTAKEAGVKIVAGDTKVVERGKADGMFINTAGIGEIASNINVSVSNAKQGNSVIISGTLGDHEMSILKEREGIGFESEIISDCAPLGSMVKELLDEKIRINVMRDPTRGGIAAALNEIASSSKIDIVVYEEKIPVSKTVSSACDLLGFEVYHLANEGKMVIVVEKEDEENAINILKKNKYGKNAKVIGFVREKDKKTAVILKTKAGGERLLLVPEGEQLPRIC